MDSTLAWKDVRTLAAGATGSGSWACGAEGGSFTLGVTTTGDVELTLFRNGQPASEAWRGQGLYSPRSMAGAFEGVDIPWSAQHP